MNLFEKIQNLASEKGITIAALERQLGFGNATLKKWGTSAPSSDRLAKVADFFGVTTDYLLGRNSNINCIDNIELNLNRVLAYIEEDNMNLVDSQRNAIKNHLSDTLLLYSKLLKNFEDISQDWREKGINEVSSGFDMRAAYYREALQNELNKLQEWIGSFPSFISRKESESNHDTYSHDIAQETAGILNSVIEREMQDAKNKSKISAI